MEVSSFAEQLLFTTIKIESWDPKKNYYCGTGFFFSYIIRHGSQSTSTHYIVTNKHVVENGVETRLTFLKGESETKPLLGERVELNIQKNWWYFNENEEIDIAILPLSDLLLFFASQSENIFSRFISNEMIPDEESLKEIDALEEVVFIGYPQGLWDEKNFLPVFRKGITASPITVDFNGKKIFLIDASVFEGSSGSPVFLYNPGLYSSKSGNVTIGTRLLFLGILSKGKYFKVSGKMHYLFEKIKSHSKKRERITPIPLTEQSLHIGVVFKSSAIISTIHEFLPHYQKWRARFFTKKIKELP